MSEMAQSQSIRSQSRSGVVMTALSFTIWGLAPLYWKLLDEINPWELLAHRVAWSAVVAAFLVIVLKRWREIAVAFRRPMNLLNAVGCGVLIATNWGIFLYAVSIENILESSLGYFIAPLMHVMIGCVFLKERLRAWQFAAFALAAGGVANMIYTGGRVPWIAIGLAVSFCLYAVLRKKSQLESLPGLSAEMAPLALPAIAFLAMIHRFGGGVLPTISWPMMLLLISTGAVTAAPLLCFAYGARRVTLTTVGFCQYIGPTAHFLLAVFVFREKFIASDLFSFVLIWIALGIYSWDGLRNHVRLRAGAAQPQPVTVTVTEDNCS